MKKNKMMRLASSLLVAVLLTTSVISGTFAKYTTSGNATDSARVAKWGVEVTVQGQNAFMPSYTNSNSDITVKTSTTITVDGVEVDEDILAPGTNGTLGTVSITGTTEVAVGVNNIANLELENWTVGASEYYCPLVFVVTVGSDTTTINGWDCLSVDELELAVENLINTATPTQFAPNAALSSKNVEVTWSWPFENSNTDNVKDTLLGEKAITANAPSIEFSIETRIDQVD